MEANRLPHKRCSGQRIPGTAVPRGTIGVGGAQEYGGIIGCTARNGVTTIFKRPIAFLVRCCDCGNRCGQLLCLLAPPVIYLTMFASGGIVGEARQQLIVQFLVPRLWFVPRGTIGLAATVHWGKGSGPG